MDIHYIKLPIHTIPFEEIPSLQSITYSYIYCSYFSLKPFKGLDYYLLSVYDAFDLNHKDLIEDNKLLFGRVISEEPSKRGIDKVIKIKTDKKQISSEDLPHLKYSNNNQLNGNWFYMKNGDYFAFSAIKSSFDKVSHLEGIAIYGDIILRLRIVIELLKKNIRKGLVVLSEKELNNIGFKVLRSEPTTKKISDEDIQNGLNNWLPSMLTIPIFDEIPDEYKERVKSLK
ncbi:hypothetical protein D9M68_526950 [compost metagenome]